MRIYAAAVLATVLSCGGTAAAQAPGGVTSPNVRFVKNLVRHSDSSGAKLVDGFYYVTTERDLAIYDTRADPENPVLVSDTVLARPGTPTLPEEDLDTNGRILVISNVDTLIYDVADKTAPKLLGTVPGVDQHTVSCILDCTWIYGSGGAVIDARDPAHPKDAGSWADNLQPPPSSFHDVTEVAPGLVVSSSEPFFVLDARADPAHPTVLATGRTPGFMHANLWPHLGSDDFLLVGGEATGPGCADSPSATFMVFDTRNWITSGFRLLSEYRMKTGTVTDGRNVDSSFCVHWFSPHPSYANGGLVAVSWYEHGTRFLKVDMAGKLEEIGYYLPYGGQSSDVDWVTDRVAYVTDYLRGVDILRFTGDVPPGFPKGAPPSTSTPVTPSVARPTIDRLVTFAPRRSCRRAATLRIRVRSYRADPVRSVVVRVNGRRVRTLAGRTLRTGARLRRLSRKRLVVQVVALTRSGFQTAGQRTYAPCR